MFTTAPSVITDYIIPIILACAAIINLILCIVHFSRKGRGKRGSAKAIFSAFYLETLVCLILSVVIFWQPILSLIPPLPEKPAETGPVISAVPTQTTAPTQTEPVQTEPPQTEPEPEPVNYLENFHPHMTESSDPANWGVKWEILENRQQVDSYTRPETIVFGEPEEYDTFPGISTFRGNNFRNNAAYGNPEIAEGTLSKKWSVFTGSLNGWFGSGWTGQPLVVKWDAETKRIMNLYPEKQEKEDLVEVIYATLDGYIYFLDLEDGTRTRSSLYVGANFKGSGSLDPRGYPLLYVGSGDIDSESGAYPRMYIISLIDGKILWQNGHHDYNAYRDWCGYDGAPLIHAETDTLIWGGENGILYTFHLNTQYDKEAGTISVEPEYTAAARYKNTRTSYGLYPLGMEDSPLMVGNYLYISDNSGMFFCVDINTMELVWVQDTKDDNNTTAVFEWGEDGNGYLYTSPSLKWSCGDSDHGDLYIFKLDAQTGEILWQKPYFCYTDLAVPGGVLSSPALGKPGTDLEGLVFFSVSSYTMPSYGIITALDTETGEPVWTTDMYCYGWSSPVDFYTEDGKGYLLMGCLGNIMYLIDGSTGEILSRLDLGGHIEASPVVYDNTVVIGTRGNGIFGLELG